MQTLQEKWASLKSAGLRRTTPTEQFDAVVELRATRATVFAKGRTQVLQGPPEDLHRRVLRHLVGHALAAEGVISALIRGEDEELTLWVHPDGRLAPLSSLSRLSRGRRRHRAA